MSGITNLADLLKDNKMEVLEVSNFYDVPDHGNTNDHVVLGTVVSGKPYACVVSLQAEDLRGFKSYLKTVHAGAKVEARFTKRVGKQSNEKGQLVDDPSDVVVSCSPVPPKAPEAPKAQAERGTKGQGRISKNK